MSKLDKAIVILASIFILMILSFVVYMLYLGNVTKDTTPNKSAGESVYDPNLIPTYLQVNEVMDALVNDVFGDDYYGLMEKTTSNVLKVPNSYVTIPTNNFGDARDLAAITALVYYRNPYLNKPEGMSEDSPLLPSSSESIKELPTGGTIDLSSIVEDYSDISLYYSRTNPLHISIEGKSNGSPFTEDIDLTTFYQYYFYE